MMMWIFVDTGAIVNVIFEDCFDQKSLDGVVTALHGFAEGSLMYLGSINLILTLGEGDLRVSKPIIFLVVRQKLSYNVILGRIALNFFQAVVSTYYIMMTFMVGNKISYAAGDQLLS